MDQQPQNVYVTLTFPLLSRETHFQQHITHSFLQKSSQFRKHHYNVCYQWQVVQLSAESVRTGTKYHAEAEMLLYS